MSILPTLVGDAIGALGLGDVLTTLNRGTVLANDPAARLKEGRGSEMWSTASPKEFIGTAAEFQRRTPAARKTVDPCD